MPRTKSKKRANGEGSFYQLKNRTWVCQITLGRHSDGRLNRKSFSGRTRAICTEKRDLYLVELNRRLSVQEQSETTLADKAGDMPEQQEPTTFNKEFMLWLNLKAPPTRKATTYSGYLHTFERHLSPFFGDMPILEITRETVQEYYRAKQMNGARYDGKDGGLSPKTIRGHHMLLKGFFDYMVDKHKLPENPTLKTDRPRIVAPKMRVLDPDEMRIFLQEVLRETQRTAILFDLFTGLRVGELLAAHVDDIDLKMQAITIQRNVARVKTEAIDLNNPHIRIQNYNPGKKTHLIIQDTPKTEKGTRSIPISDELFALLAKHLYFLEQSNWPNPNNLLFPSTKGTYIDPKSFEVRLAAISKRCELLKVNPHALRHTFATRLVEHGVPLTTIMELLGHASVSTTQKYITTLVEEKRDAIDKISSLLDPDSLFAEQNLNGSKHKMKFEDVRLPSWLQNEPQKTQNGT